MKQRDLFNLSQEIREEDKGFAFLSGKCECQEHLGVFVSGTQEFLMNISSTDKRSLNELLKELRKRRNKLNRQISTLKKATLKT